MLTGFLGVLLAASIASPTRHVAAPEDVCLLRDRCATRPAFCLLDAVRCTSQGDVVICYVSHCPEPGPDLIPRGRGSSR